MTYPGGEWQCGCNYGGMESKDWPMQPVAPAVNNNVTKELIELTDPTFLFVYGSLKKNYKHHGMLGKAVFLGSFVTRPNYLLYDTGPYPGMIFAGEGLGRSIEGELYQVPLEQMRKLDKAVPCQFNKKLIKLKERKEKVITHIWHFGVEKFLDCGTSWPRT